MVRRIATLARLEVADRDLPVLTGQLARIVSYIDQIREIAAGELPGASPAAATPVRPDVSRPPTGREALDANAPRQLHGYGVVPRVVG
jgi:aspartyl-tRNA(Asn)/glutamyl-tRNA(Gln) amidotransferase subunit C